MRSYLLPDGNEIHHGKVKWSAREPKRENHPFRENVFDSVSGGGLARAKITEQLLAQPTCTFELSDSSGGGANKLAQAQKYSARSLTRRQRHNRARRRKKVSNYFAQTRYAEENRLALAKSKNQRS